MTCMNAPYRSGEEEPVAVVGIGGHALDGCNKFLAARPEGTHNFLSKESGNWALIFAFSESAPSFIPTFSFLDFMLVYLPVSTVALRPPLALNARPIAKFFHGCPDNAFHVFFHD
ncbi:hypothetical protein Fmac_008378 [Flemingia macrophylla]|uniref:Uncharacterized protein n=1 Tax=Flemingia macrophylla TaxID=520843 RepID=A0ABD1MX93_9FABA